jgi:Zn-dependent peptidase ImmA (M78 family)
MSLSRGFYIKIEALVEQALEEANILNAPIPVETIARNCGAVVIPYELGEEVSGVLVVNDSKGVIGYNRSHPKVRQRFTIAHELGHLILHVNKSRKKELFVDKDFIVKLRSNKKYSPTEVRNEREANVFAAAILMPKKLILQELRKEKYAQLTENRLIEELAKIFDVSIQAMTYRFADLNYYFLA